MEATKTRGFRILRNGLDCFGSLIDDEAVVFQLGLWDRDGLLDEITVLDESGTEYDKMSAVLFGRVEAKS